MFIVSEKQEIQASYLKIAYFNLSVLSKSLWFLQSKGKSLKKKSNASVPGDLY